MSALSFVQLEALWIAAGGEPSYAPTMAAVAYGESGGDPTAVQKGQPTATTGWGLWQITPGTSEPQVGVNDALLDPMTNAKAAVAKFDAAAAAGENPMQPWGGGTTDRVGQTSVNLGRPLTLAEAEAFVKNFGYGNQLSGAQDTLKLSAAASKVWANIFVQTTTNFEGGVTTPGANALAPAVSDVTGAASDVVSGVTTTAGLIGDLTNGSLWIRIGEGALGIFLIIVGGIIFFKGTDTGQKISGDVPAAAAVAAA